MLAAGVRGGAPLISRVSQVSWSSPPAAARTGSKTRLKSLEVCDHRARKLSPFHIDIRKGTSARTTVIPRFLPRRSRIAFER